MDYDEPRPYLAGIGYDERGVFLGRLRVGDIHRGQQYDKWFPVVNGHDEPVALLPTYNDAILFVRACNHARQTYLDTETEHG